MYITETRSLFIIVGIFIPGIIFHYTTGSEYIADEKFGFFMEYYEI